MNPLAYCAATHTFTSPRSVPSTARLNTCTANTRLSNHKQRKEIICAPYLRRGVHRLCRCTRAAQQRVQDLHAHPCLPRAHHLRQRAHRRPAPQASSETYLEPSSGGDCFCTHSPSFAHPGACTPRNAGNSTTAAWRSAATSSSSTLALTPGTPTLSGIVLQPLGLRSAAFSPASVAASACSHKQCLIHVPLAQAVVGSFCLTGLPLLISSAPKVHHF